MPDNYISQLNKIRYLANHYIILELDQSLSSLYWINVNDPLFPFVGVIEHTNFAKPANYGGSHIVYLSRYCAQTDPFLSLSTNEAVEFATTHLKRMFRTSMPESYALPIAGRRLGPSPWSRPDMPSLFLATRRHS